MISIGLLIAVDKNIKEKIGVPALIKKQNKDTLIIQVRSLNQGNLLKQVTELAQNPVTVKEHTSLNQCRGTVYSEALSNSSINEIEEALRNQQVAKVEGKKTKVRGELKNTHRYIITFSKPDLHQNYRLTL